MHTSGSTFQGDCAWLPLIHQFLDVHPYVLPLPLFLSPVYYRYMCSWLSLIPHIWHMSVMVLPILCEYVPDDPCPVRYWSEMIFRFLMLLLYPVWGIFDESPGPRLTIFCPSSLPSLQPYHPRHPPVFRKSRANLVQEADFRRHQIQGRKAWYYLGRIRRDSSIWRYGPQQSLFLCAYEFGAAFLGHKDSSPNWNLIEKNTAWLYTAHVALHNWVRRYWEEVFP